MTFFQYPTISSWFDVNGDFPENSEDPRDNVRFEETDEGVKWFINECGEAYAYPAELQEECFPADDHTPYDSREEADAASGNAWEPCCYNSTRNFGTGDHEWGCPNY